MPWAAAGWCEAELKKIIKVESEMSSCLKELEITAGFH
jgi:hypothetical protein